MPEEIRRGQAGGGLLTVVATLGLLLLLAQGSSYYRARTSAKFLGGEKNKVLALQMAEAGVEDNIADIGMRKIKITGHDLDTFTYVNKPLEGGTYSSRLKTVAMGPKADTVDLTSTGLVGGGSSSVLARLRLKKYLDTTKTPILHVIPETTWTVVSRSVPHSDTTVTVKDPETMPAVNTTPAYTACMGSSAKKCDICHLPGGDASKANVINVAKSAIGTHISHHGDYVTTDGTCDLYKPKTVITITYHVTLDSTRVVTDHSTYDTTVVIDTAVKVQILSWK